MICIFVNFDKSLTPDIKNTPGLLSVSNAGVLWLEEVWPGVRSVGW